MLRSEVTKEDCVCECAPTGFICSSYCSSHRCQSSTVTITVSVNCAFTSVGTSLYSLHAHFVMTSHWLLLPFCCTKMHKLKILNVLWRLSIKPKSVCVRFSHQRNCKQKRNNITECTDELWCCCWKHIYLKLTFILFSFSWLWWSASTFLGDNAKHLIVPGSSEGQFTSFQYSTNFICLGLRVLVGQDKTFEDITSFITNTTQKSLFVACLHLDMIVCRNYNYYIIFYNKYRSLDL